MRKMQGQAALTIAHRHEKQNSKIQFDWLKFFHEENLCLTFLSKWVSTLGKRII